MKTTYFLNKTCENIFIQSSSIYHISTRNVQIQMLKSETNFCQNVLGSIILGSHISSNFDPEGNSCVVSYAVGPGVVMHKGFG